MCDYIDALHVAIEERFKESKAFTALEIRDAVRALEPNKDVRYRECKHETLTYFEQEAPKGWKAVPVSVNDSIRVWTFAPPKWRQKKAKIS